MVIVGGSFEVEPSEREEFLADRHQVMRASRAEPGCLEYTFGADPIDPGRVVLFERWADQECLDAHLAAQRGGGSDRTVTPKAFSIVLYDVAGERALGG